MTWPLPVKRNSIHRCLGCLQQVKHEYALVKNKLEALFNVSLHKTRFTSEQKTAQNMGLKMLLWKVPDYRSHPVFIWLELQFLQLEQQIVAAGGSPSIWTLRTGEAEIKRWSRFRFLLSGGEISSYSVFFFTFLPLSVGSLGGWWRIYLQLLSFWMHKTKMSALGSWCE